MTDTWFTASWRLSASLNSPSRYSWPRSRNSSDTSRHGVTVYRGMGAEMARASIELFFGGGGAGCETFGVRDSVDAT